MKNIVGFMQYLNPYFGAWLVEEYSYVAISKTGGGSNDGPVRAVQECSTPTLFLGTRLN